MSKYMMEIYDGEKIQSFRRLGLTVECMTAYDSTLLICIRGGLLMEYKTSRRVSAGTKPKQTVHFESKTYPSFSNKPVTEIHAFPECGLLFSLSDSVLHIYDLNTLEYKMDLSKSKGTSLVAFDTKEKRDGRNTVIQYGATLKICAAIGRKLQLENMECECLLELPSKGGSNEHLTIYVGCRNYKKHYQLSVNKGQCYIHAILQYTIELWKWKNNVIQEIQMNLNLCKAPRALVWSKKIMFVGFKNEYYTIQVSTGEVEDLMNVGSRQKEPLLSKLDSHTVLVGYDNRSVLFDVSQGQPKKKDDSLMWSSVPRFIECDVPYIVGVLEKHIEVRSFKSSALLQILDFKNVRFICKGSDCLFVESHNTVTVLVPKLINERISHHMDQDQFEVALQLVQRSFSLEGSEAQKYHFEEEINCRHAIHLFCQQKYKEAMDIFSKLDLDPAHVIGLYPHLLPKNLKSSFTYPKDIPRLEGGDFEKALIELIYYLNEKRELMEKQENWKPLTPVMEKSETLKTKEQVLTVIDTTLLKCYLSTNEAMIATLLRTPDHHVSVKEAEKVLLKKQKFSELIILYQQHDMHVEALEMMKVQASKPQSPLFGPDMTIHYLQGLGEKHLSIIFKYAEWVLKEYLDEGLKIFTEDEAMVQDLPRGSVLSFLKKISKDLAIYYLEHVIYLWKDTSEELHFSLVQLLHGKVEKLYSKFKKSQPEGHLFPRARDMAGELGKFRKKFIYFLETSQIYKAADVLTRFTTLGGFHEEKAILFGRLHRHEQALGIYVLILQDQSAAEDCDGYFVQQSKMVEQFSSRIIQGTILTEMVYLTLLEIYIKPPESAVLGLSEYQFEPKPNYAAAITLLKKHPVTIDIFKALEILPPELEVKELHSYLDAAIQSFMSHKYECLIKRKMQTAELSKVSYERIQFNNTSFVITEEQTCQACQMRIGNSFFARYPNGTIVHYSCCKDSKTPIDRTPSLASLQKVYKIEYE